MKVGGAIILGGGGPEDLVADAAAAIAFVICLFIVDEALSKNSPSTDDLIKNSLQNSTQSLPDKPKQSGNSSPKIVPDPSSGTQKDKKSPKEPPQITIMIQDCTKGVKDDTLSSSGGIVGVPEKGVTKAQGLLGLRSAVSSLESTSGFKKMTKSASFGSAVAEMQRLIVNSKGIPDGQNVYQTFFNYDGRRYRIDLDSWRGEGKNLSE